MLVSWDTEDKCVATTHDRERNGEFNQSEINGEGERYIPRVIICSFWEKDLSSREEIRLKQKALRSVCVWGITEWWVNRFKAAVCFSVKIIKAQRRGLEGQNSSQQPQRNEDNSHLSLSGLNTCELWAYLCAWRLSASSSVWGRKKKSIINDPSCGAELIPTFLKVSLVEYVQR